MSYASKKRWAVRSGDALTRRHIYLLPNKSGIIFIVTCVVMIGFGLNYENNLVLFMALFALSVLITSVYYSYENMKGLSMSYMDPPNNIHAGDSIYIPLYMKNEKHDHVTREMHVMTGLGPDIFIENVKSGHHTQLTCPCPWRGYFEIPVIRMESTYPLGLIRGFSYCFFEEMILVYPKIISCEYMLQKETGINSASRSEHRSSNSRGRDEISGLKKYTPGDPINLIDWKQLALGRGLMVKDFSADDAMDMYLTEASIKSRELEEQISMLTYAVIDLSQRNIQFGFRFREIFISPDSGPEHRQRILRELALYQPTS
ncbi:DUF58 domain-containing protein [uncultured Ruminobacter sp.]|uniref:DUF58 domain-containing protein n=1 Tax=uncultured Ruminobacter sp. TaxID=538947 RepID=UPI0026059233|nr:DUF58 domain-containing protein [uncultured Ruminobacter sp.]